MNADNPVPVIGIDRPTIERNLKNVAQKDFVIIDGAPQAADLAISAIKAADIAFFPSNRRPMTFGLPQIWLIWSNSARK